jgi:hypothetical protein
MDNIIDVSVYDDFFNKTASQVNSKMRSKYYDIMEASKRMDEQENKNQDAATQILFINKLLHQEDYIYSHEFIMKMANFTDNGDGTLTFKRPAPFVDETGEDNG